MRCYITRKTKKKEMLILIFVLLYMFIWMKLQKKEEIYILTILAFVTLCYFSNEILSCFKRLDRVHLQVVYAVICVGLTTGILHGVIKSKRKLEAINIFRFLRANKSGCLFALFSVMMLFMAIVTVPYNWDSMSYHLPRIMQWVQNKSVAHYAVSDVRQLSSPVLAEFISLQIYLTTGKCDNVFNFLQCTSFVTNAMLIYKITHKLGVDRKYCKLSLLLFISMPIAFGEALSTQVDQFATLFLLMYVYFILDLLEENIKLQMERNTILYVLVLSSCIGYGYLAKPSIMFGIVAFALWLLGVCIRRRDNLKVTVKLILIAGITIFVIVCPEVWRNIKTFDAIADASTGARQLVGTLNPLYLIVNGLTNYTMNLPNMYINWGGIIEHGVYWIAYILGVNIHDPAIAEDGKEFYLHMPRTYDHDTAINPTVAICATIVMAWLIVRKLRKEKYDFAEKYCIVAIVTFLGICVFFRWEPFVTRYMLAYLALLCPVIAVWVDRMKNRQSATAISGIIFFVCIVEMLGLIEYHGNIYMQQRKSSKLSAYFEVRRQDEDKYIELEKVLKEKNYKNIGLYLNGNSYEYPIWMMAGNDARIENVLVSNQTAIYADESFEPDAIIVVDINTDEGIEYKGQVYKCYKDIEDSISVWEK